MFALFAAIVIWTFIHLMHYPPTVTAATTAPGQANITMQTVGAIGTEPHPPWVSYLIQRPDGTWAHTTVLKVPAHTTVHVTIYQYDSGSDLRNPLMNQVQGVDGATVDGKPYSTWTDVIGHTFTVPQLGISVPLPGIPDDAKNPCSTNAPCSPSFDHMKVQFSFVTGAAGTYTWQCFVPCGVGYIAGFGGPMSTVGYMNGVMQVTA
ncbi:MAG: hypothetical protein QOG80_3250 [Pseudonocardiales bacterium]|nr:hypothetical protein [Pseudonocardiales bacterium]